MTNPYETLGVAKDATLDQIKKVYRQKSKKCHPDAGGDGEEFKRISSAYELLSNQERRDHFDRTGETAEVEDPSLSIVSQLLGSVLLGILNAGGDPEKTDLVKLMRNKAKEEITQLKATISVNKKRVDKLRKVAKRVLYKSKADDQDNILARMVLVPIEAIEASIKEREATLQGYTKALKIIEHYSYNFDAAQTDKPTYQWSMQWGTSPFSFPSGSFHFDGEDGEEEKTAESLKKQADGHLRQAFERHIQERK